MFFLSNKVRDGELGPVRGRGGEGGGKGTGESIIYQYKSNYLM